MKEFIEKLIGRLEEREVQAYAKMDGGVTYQAYRNAIEIVIELAEEYKDAEEQGLLLRLPCKVGDTVYSVVKDGLQIFELKFSLDFYVRRMSDFGKTVFLTKAKAEQALKQIGE